MVKNYHEIVSFMAIFSTSVVLDAAEIDFYDDPNLVTKIRY